MELIVKVILIVIIGYLVGRFIYFKYIKPKHFERKATLIAAGSAMIYKQILVERGTKNKDNLSNVVDIDGITIIEPILITGNSGISIGLAWNFTKDEEGLYCDLHINKVDSRPPIRAIELLYPSMAGRSMERTGHIINKSVLTGILLSTTKNIDPTIPKISKQLKNGK